MRKNRYAEDVKQGLGEEKKGGAGRVMGGGKKKTQDEAGGLFD